MLVVFDDDEPGKAAHKMLRERFNFHPRKELLSVGEVIADRNIGAEAEDLFPQELVDAFVKENGEAKVVKSKP